MRESALRTAGLAGCLALAWLLSDARTAGGDPQRPDTPALELGSPDLERVPLELERRKRIEEAVKSRAYEDAEALILAEIERQPRSSELLRLLGGVFFVRGRYLNSAVAMKKAEALAPLDERSRFTLAMAYVVLDRRDWARPELTKLVEENPKSALYRYWTARLDYDQGRYAAAVESLRRVVELDPRFVKAHDSLGLCHEALGQYDEAVRSYEEAIRLNRASPTPSPWPALNLGILLGRLNRPDEAESRFREALRHDPHFAQAHYQLGLALERKGSLKQAEQELRHAAGLDSSYAEPHYALARLYRRRGDAPNADRALETFQALKRRKEASPDGPQE